MRKAPCISGLNHLTLSVCNLDRSVRFYREILGMELRAQWDRGAYLEAGSLWLCLMKSEHTDSIGANDYSHIALNVDAADFAALAETIATAAERWQDNSSEGDSHYFRDPDGHKLEIHSGTLETRLAHYRRTNTSNIEIFD